MGCQKWLKNIGHHLCMFPRINWSAKNCTPSIPVHIYMYYKVASSRLSWLVAHLRIFRLFMKGKFDANVLWPLAQRVQNWIVYWSTARDITVIAKLKRLKLFNICSRLKTLLCFRVESLLLFINQSWILTKNRALAVGNTFTGPLTVFWCSAILGT